MWFIRFSMRRPKTVMVAVLAVALLAFLAVTRMKVDIFPDLNLPVVYVVQPYGGMDPAQMEGYMVAYYEQHFLYITGIEHIESKSIQSVAVMKLYFHPGTNMADAMAQVVAQVERSKSYMPPGTVDPFVLRFDVGNVPVGFLVFSSPTRSVGDIQDLVFVRVRPVVSTLPGASTPPPFGGNQRSIVIRVDSDRLRQYHLSPDDLVKAIASDNAIVPSGVVRTGNLQRISSINSVVGNIQDLGNVPLRLGAGPAVYLRDVAQIKDSTDIPTGYALVNGRRTVYIAVSKRADASTLSVVNSVRAAIPHIRSLLPEDIKVRFEFDQSAYVTDALKGLTFEGSLGAVLTGLMVLLFLRDLRSSLIVVLNIPLALLAALVSLWLSGQTINIMTLGGLALSVGILVDEATVAIENIHSHLARGQSRELAVYQALIEVVTPRLLAMLSVISVFIPSFFMVGSTQALFVPLSLAVGFAMAASYVLSNTFVPVMSCWLLKGNLATAEHGGLMEKLKQIYERLLVRLLPLRWPTLGAYVLLVSISFLAIAPTLGSEIFPAGNPNGFRLRLSAPVGTRIERTEEFTRQALQVISQAVGPENVEVTVAYVGTQPTTYAICNVYIWTSGPHEALILVSLKPQSHIRMSELKERLRRTLMDRFPTLAFTFEAGDIVNEIMNFGARTPIQVDIDGPSFDRDQDYARKLVSAMRKLPTLRDVEIVQPLDYPTVDVTVDRERAGQLGLNITDVGHALVAATYSSRFVSPVFWRDATSGMAYQVQLEVPQSEIRSIKDIENIPVKTGRSSEPFVRDVGAVSYGTMPGEFDRYNMARMVSISANIAGDDLGRAAREVQNAIARTGMPPRGTTVHVRGQVPLLSNTFAALGQGLTLAVVVIFLLLVGYFQSVRLALTIVSIVPAVIGGAITGLWVSGTTINVQSFMGTIMAIGIGVANAILVVAFSEQCRLAGAESGAAAIEGGKSRLRPVLMTSIAMIAGMLPMALGLGEGGERTAPLGRSVIGGLIASTTCVLLILPLIFATLQRGAGRSSPALLPEEMLT